MANQEPEEVKRLGWRRRCQRMQLTSKWGKGIRTQIMGCIKKKQKE